MGTLKGEHASISLLELSGEMSIRADSSTCMGALGGKSRIYSAFVSVNLHNAGKNALAFGGMSDDTDLVLNNADTRVDLHNLIGVDTYAKQDRIRIINGRINIAVNDKQVKRELVYDFNE